MNAPPAEDGATTRHRLRYGRAVPLVLGALVWLVASLVGAHEARSYSANQSPPRFVELTRGQQYSLDTPGGLAADSSKNPVCTISSPAQARTALALAPETNTKALHRIATFIAPSSGKAHITCSGLAVYVDDANGNVDLAGMLRVLAAILLAVGVPLLLGELAGASRRAT